MIPEAAPILGRMLLLAGIVMAAVGLFLMLGPRLPAFFGRLPGDFQWGRGNVRVYFPLGTCLLISLVLTLVVWLISLVRR